MDIDNALTRASRNQKIRDAIKQFPQLATRHDQLGLCAMQSFSRLTPEKFFDAEVFQNFYAWLDEPTRQHSLVTQFIQERHRLSIAFRTLSEINRQSWHDNYLGKEVERLKVLDTYLHPAYLRLIEGVLYSFLAIAAKQSRIERGVSTEGLNLFNVIDELQNRGFAKACSAYEQGMRNGIAHGDILYGDQSITYTDARKKPISVDVYSVIEKCDFAVDVCNAIAAAIKVFLLIHLQDPSMFPHEVMVEDFQSALQAPWWQIESCLPSTIANQSQLNIYAKASTLDYDKVFYSCVESGVLAEHHMPGFQRYFVNIASDKALPGWAAFNGDILREARINNSSISQMMVALEDGLVFYTPQIAIPKLLRRLNTLRLAVKAQFEEIHVEKSVAGKDSKFVIRAVKTHVKRGTLFGLTIEARVILRELDSERIREVISRIYQQVINEAKRNTIQNRLTGVGFVRIFMYDEDMRKRKLESYGLGPLLVGTIQVKANHNIRTVDIATGHVEQFGHFRIAWNRKWNKYSSLTIR